MSNQIGYWPESRSQIHDNGYGKACIMPNDKNNRKNPVEPACRRTIRSEATITRPKPLNKPMKYKTLSAKLRKSEVM